MRRGQGAALTSPWSLCQPSAPWGAERDRDGGTEGGEGGGGEGEIDLILSMTRLRFPGSRNGVRACRTFGSEFASWGPRLTRGFQAPHFN